MDRSEFLKSSQLPKPLYCPFSSPEGLVGVFRPIVQPTACLLARSIAYRSQRRLAITALGNKRFEAFAFMVDGAPKIMDLTVDADEHLIQMPTPLRPNL